MRFVTRATLCLFALFSAGCSGGWQYYDTEGPSVEKDGYEIDTPSKWNKVFSAYSEVILKSPLTLLGEDFLFVVPKDKTLNMNGERLTIGQGAKLILAGSIIAEAENVEAAAETIVITTEGGSPLADDLERHGLSGLPLISFLAAKKYDSSAAPSAIETGGYVIGDAALESDVAIDAHLVLVGKLSVKEGKKLTVKAPLNAAWGKTVVEDGGTIEFSDNGAIVGETQITVEEGADFIISPTLSNDSIFTGDSASVVLEHGAEAWIDSKYYAGVYKTGDTTPPILDTGAKGVIKFYAKGTELQGDFVVKRNKTFNIAARKTLIVNSTLKIEDGATFEIAVDAKLGGTGAVIVADGATLECVDNSDDNIWADNSIGIKIESGAKAYMGAGAQRVYYAGSEGTPAVLLSNGAYLILAKRRIDVFGNFTLPLTIIPTRISPIHTVTAHGTCTVVNNSILYFDGSSSSGGSGAKLGGGKIVVESGAYFIANKKDIFAPNSAGEIALQGGAKYYEDQGYELNYMNPLGNINTTLTVNTNSTFTLKRTGYVVKGTITLGASGWTLPEGLPLTGVEGAEIITGTGGLTFSKTQDLLGSTDSWGASNGSDTFPRVITNQTLTWRGGKWNCP